ncbi:hypothetical protein CR513_21298, partial [Mucuna pruriens]
MESESSHEESSSSSKGESSSDYSYDEGDLLTVRRLMAAQVNMDSDFQRETIFHSRCHVKGKLCSIIIDSGSCDNMASLRLVKKLNLPTIVHTRPYKFIHGGYSHPPRKMTHDGLTNKFSFVHMRQKVTFKPLSPSE